MAIKPICDICKKKLNEFGAILLSPPDEQNSVKKFHICKECYNKLVKEKFNLQQAVRKQEQENQAKSEALYEEILDLYDSLEFLLNYLDTNSKEEFNPKVLKSLPRFVASMQEKLLTILGKREVNKIELEGNLPDFSVCQVVDQEIRDDLPEATITKIVRDGFKIKGKVLRPVEVITAKSQP